MQRSNGHSSMAEVEQTQESVSRDLSQRVYESSPRFRSLTAVLGILFILGIIGFIVRAVGDSGDRTAWGYYAAMFAFLLTTVSSAPLVAVAFRFTKSHWRRPFSRISESFALVGVLTLLWFIPMTLLLPSLEGRRSLWFEGPIGAPLWWDFFAVLFLVICGLAILYFSALPDMATVARHGTGIRARLLSRLSGLWRGTERQWGVHKAALAVLGAFYFMTLVWLHTLISTDFSMALIPGWKDSIFPPHHALTGLQAALGIVLVTAYLLRRFGGYRDYIGMEPFWSASKVLLGLTLLWGYFWFAEFNTFWYGRMPIEQEVIKLLMFESYRTAFLLNIFFSFLIPFGMLIWNPVRKSILGPTIAGASVVIGAFFMMVRVYVPAFRIEDVTAHALMDVPREQLLPVLPDVWDYLIIIGGIAGAALIYILGSKILSVMSIWETKEGLQYLVVRPFMRGRYRVIGKPE